MSLRNRIVLVTGLILLLCLGLLYAVARTVLDRGFSVIQKEMMEGFARVESDDARNNVKRVLDALDADLENILTKLSDWAIWDDTYQYVKDHNPHYQKNNFTETGIANLKLNFWAVYDSKERPVYFQTYDLEKEKTVETPPELLEYLKPGSVVLRHPDTGSRFKGVLLLNRHPFLAVSHPILTNEAGGPVRGTFIFGKFLDEKAAARLGEITHLHIRFWRLDDPLLSGKNRIVLSKLEGGTDVAVLAERQDTISGYALIRDAGHRPALLLQVDMKRNIHNQATATLNGVSRQADITLAAIMAGLVVAVLLLVILILWNLHTSVLVRLFRLSSWTGNIGDRRDFSGRFPVDRKDELGSLAASINGMLDSLEKAHNEIIRNMEKIKAVHEEMKKMEDQLRQAQKMEAIGLLAGGIAHDFNNMLAAISGFAEIIQTKFGRGNPVLSSFSGTILDTSRRAADLTGQLLSFARKGKFEVVSLDVNEVVRDVIGLLAHTIDRRITLSEQLQAGPVRVMADRNQLQNAIMNLAVNARDAMPEGGAMTFATEEVDLDERYVCAHPYRVATGRYARITVTDTGVGMDKETQSRLFEPFFTTKGVGKGTGLGLASVYGTVKSHNGSIGVYSEKGRGTTFKIYLPLSGTPQAEEARKPVSLRRGSGRLLLIDDELPVREMYKAMFEELGYGVTVAGDGAEGAAYYKDHWQEVDLVILDVIMPVMGGPECLKKLKAVNPSVKVIATSGFQANGEVRQTIELGARGFVQKPADMITISHMIYDAINSQPVNGA